MSAHAARSVRESPFRETEWDRRLDDMLEDLENSTVSSSAVAQQKCMQQSSITTASTSSSATKKSAGASVSIQRSSSAHHQGSGGTSGSGSSSSYGRVQPALQKSPSGTSLLGENTDVLLKEMDSALKASSNYIENHSRSSTQTGPGTRQTTEYHEYRSYSSNGGGGGGGSGGEFNLEKQVQHMMPPPSPSLSGLIERSNNARNFSSSHQQQSSSTSTQQQQQQFTSYKVQSNQYSSSGDRVMISDETERPSSRLKQNIDELDTLLSDLNNAKGGVGDYTSDDYSFSTAGQRTYNSSTEYHSHTGKPPSPSPRRRPSDGRADNPRSLSSPATVRKVSPSPVRVGGRGASPPSSATAAGHYHSSSSSHHHESSHQKTTTSSMQEYARSSPAPPATNGGTPTGTSYYQKYHSSYQSQQGYSPNKFPASKGGPGNGSTQVPPKRVDDLMTELSEFDPSIQPTGFVEPPPKTETDYARQYRDRSASPVRGGRGGGSPTRGSPVRSRSSPPPGAKGGPAVYYPPGEMFSTTRAKYTDSMDSSGLQGKRQGEVETTAVMQEGGGGRGRAEYKAKYGYKEKSKLSESDGKQGAAVIPICLPLCCAAPCTIL